VATVEHLMAALGGMGIDNAYVDLNAPEVPIMDGSAWPFVQLLQSAGVVEQEASRRYLRILREVKVVRGDKEASVIPFAGFRVAFSIDYDHPLLTRQSSRCELELSEHSFVEELCQARTFAFAEEVGLLHSRGLALGGSLDNAILLGREGMLNEGGLRYEDELVKHKMLDAVGDLYLLGYPLLGEFRAHKSGHTLNRALLQALLDERDAWELVELSAGASACDPVRKVAS
jgi:UDP-3-O-[3-hydroxymyristoyl] N-acetylglucosamine deacetylase